MYSVGLPILYVISGINFILIYWIDKYLLLRIYRTPKNYDEKAINHTLEQLNYSFIFHAIIGFLMLSDNKLLVARSDGVLQAGADELIDKVENISEEYIGSQLFTEESYRSSHVTVFFLGMVFIFFCVMFKEALINQITKRCACFTAMQDRFH